MTHEQGDIDALADGLDLQDRLPAVFRSGLPSAAFSPLGVRFYNRPTLTVARELLAARLVRVLDGQPVSATIAETEAYVGESGCRESPSRNASPRAWS